jgi:hypothetical protein
MSEFASIANKEFLWNLLFERGVFNNIKNNTDKDSIQRTFENLVINIDNQCTTVESLIEKNKIFISSFLEQKPQESVRAPRIEELYSREAIAQNKQTDFDERLKQRQRDFTSELQPERPADINFSEEKDQPLNDDMNAMIQQLRSKRELDIHTIGEKQKEQQNKDHPKLIITETTVDDSVNTVNTVNTVNGSVNTVDIDIIKK